MDDELSSSRVILTNDVASFDQAFVESRQLPRVILGGSGIDEPDHWRRRLLRARNKGPHGN